MEDVFISRLWFLNSWGGGTEHLYPSHAPKGCWCDWTEDHLAQIPAQAPDQDRLAAFQKKWCEGCWEEIHNTTHLHPCESWRDEWRRETWKIERVWEDTIRRVTWLRLWCVRGAIRKYHMLGGLWGTVTYFLSSRNWERSRCQQTPDAGQACLWFPASGFWLCPHMAEASS